MRRIVATAALAPQPLLLFLLLTSTGLSSCQSQIDTSQPPTPEVQQTYWGKYFEDSQSIHINASFSQAPAVTEKDDSETPAPVERNVKLAGRNQVMLNGRLMDEQKGDSGYNYVYDAMGMPFQSLNHAFAIIFTSSDGTQYPYTLVIPPRITSSVPTAFGRDADFEIDWTVDEKLQAGETISHDIALDDLSCGVQQPVDTRISDLSGKVVVKLAGGDACGKATVAHVQLCRVGPGQTIDAAPSQAVIRGSYCAPRVPVLIH